MLDKERTKNILRLASSEVKKYFGYKKSDCFSIKVVDNPNDDAGVWLEFLVYRRFKIRIIVSDSGGKEELKYEVNIGEYYNLLLLVPYKVSERISLGKRKEDIQQSLEVLDEYLIWRMTDAQKKTFGIPLDKEVLKED
ncbi:hypothetical protein [Gemella cuniculi]|uniref:hypothetical protein n=1 Tax=Gemella cuniculi TaxID=150240 RepID=UPI00040473D3|nr:hypothetical protein [Gemella cuniculi]